MQTLSRRLTYLRNAEAFCCLAMPAIFWIQCDRSVEPVNWMMRWSAMGMVSFVLLQGVLYWHLKGRALIGRQPLPAYFQPLYRRFKYANVLLTVVVAAFIALGSAAATVEDLWFSCVLLSFAILEHINYYHYQLMYDTRAAIDYVRRNGRLRKAALGLDLERQKAPAVSA